MRNEPCTTEALISLSISFGGFFASILEAGFADRDALGSSGFWHATAGAVCFST